MAKLTRVTDAYVLVKSKIAGAIHRLLEDKLMDTISVKDFGAKGDGVTDDTQAIDSALLNLRSSGARTLYFPASEGAYLYNGTGLQVPPDCSIKFENNNTVLDASGNSNSGYLITLNGFRSRVEGGYIKGNPSNPELKGISSTYNTELGGVRDMVIDSFHVGIDIDKAWYVLFDNIRFRAWNVKLTGAHIRIGYNLRDQEVNNIHFRNIWMGEDQMHSVAVYCPNQNLTWNGCSFETHNDARIKFYTSASVNTFVVEKCYVEGGSQTGVYFAEGTSASQKVLCRDTMFRLGNTSGSCGKNITLEFDKCWGNSPNVSLVGNGQKIISDANLPFFGGGVAPSSSGIYDGVGVNSATVMLSPRNMPAKDVNSTIPCYVNYKTHTNTSALPFFDVYLPAGADVREMLLELNILTKAVNENWTLGVEKYLVGITLPQASGAGTGVFVSKVHAATKDGASMFPDVTVTVTDNGYDSATDSNRYTISHTVNNASRLGRTTMALQGVYIHGGLSDVTPKWKIRKL